MPEPARPIPRRAGPANTEEILVIEGDPRAKNPFRTVANASRHMARGQTGSTPPKAGRDRGRSASDSGGAASTLASQMALPESLTPLSSNISSLLLPGGKLLDAHTRTTDQTTEHPRAASSIISRIGNRESLRDAFVMAEILRPPVALRRGPLRISRPR